MRISALALESHADEVNRVLVVDCLDEVPVEAATAHRHRSFVIDGFQCLADVGVLQPVVELQAEDLALDPQYSAIEELRARGSIVAHSIPPGRGDRGRLHAVTGKDRFFVVLVVNGECGFVLHIVEYDMKLIQRRGLDGEDAQELQERL